MKTRVHVEDMSKEMLEKYLKDKKKSREDIKDDIVEMTEAELKKYGVYEECNEGR